MSQEPDYNQPILPQFYEDCSKITKALEDFMLTHVYQYTRFNNYPEVLEAYHNWLNEEVDNPDYFKGEAIEKPKKVSCYKLYEGIKE